MGALDEDRTGGIRILDLARPKLPIPLRAVNVLGRRTPRGWIDLEEEGLLETARRRTGLSNFGHDGYLAPMRVFLRALDEEADLSPLGRFAARELVVGLLSTRLRLARLLDAHPEIEDEPIFAPIVVMGLPRTGTTHLHSLIAADPALRSLPYWESLEPIPKEIPRQRPAPLPVESDPRFQRCVRAMKMLHYAMPLFPMMHEMTAVARHEEVQLLAVDFSTMLFEASNRVPSYRAWYTSHDQTSAYQTLRMLLQSMQWMDGRPRRWVLKSPQHLEQIGPLLAAFPDAKVIQTHRDPVRVTASFTTMGAYGLRMGTRSIDTAAHGRYWSTRIEEMLHASIDDRHLLPTRQIHDLRFHDFVGSELEAVEEIYAFAEQPLGGETRGALVAYQRANPRGRHGTIDYRLEDFDIDPAERRQALGFYSERFGLRDE